MRAAIKKRKSSRRLSVSDGSMMQIKATSITNAGLVRAANNDCFISGGYVPDWFTMQTAGRKNIQHQVTTAVKQTTCFAVFNSLSSQDDGETAAQMAAGDLQKETARLAALPLKETEALIQRYAVRMNNQMNRAARADQTLKGLQAAFVCLCLREDQAVVLGLGLNRAYLFRAGQLSLVSPEPPADQTGHYLGALPDDGRLLCASSGPFGVQPQDRFLLCTDGLTDSLDEDAIKTSLVLPEARQAAESLIAAAIGRGARENITVTVLDCQAAAGFRPASDNRYGFDSRDKRYQPGERIEHQRQVFVVPVEKKKSIQDKSSISRLQFWQMLPNWLQVWSLILLIMILLGFFLFIGPRYIWNQNQGGAQTTTTGQTGEPSEGTMTSS